VGLDLYAGKPNGQAYDDEADYEWFAGYDKWDGETPHPQWSYGGFSRFRERLAEAESFRLSDMKGFGGKRQWDTVTTTLAPLLDHSDCDGEMAPDECRQVWPRLEEIVRSWGPEIGLTGTAADDWVHDYDVQNGLALVQLMKLADEHMLVVLFR
jgi:hypothetical protein